MCVMSPGDVEEDQAIDVGEGDVLLVHLQLQLLVEAPAVADLLQTHLHIHTLVVEPSETAQMRDCPWGHALHPSWQSATCW